MKNIFIGGVSKSGKSTLSKRLKENNYNHIPLDYFASSFKRNFPETKITSNVLVTKESSENLSLFISRVIEIINTTSELFIIDSAHILPEDIIRYLNADKWDIYYLGYPNTTKEEMNKEDKLKEIRKYETEEDWTYKKSNAELLSIFDKLISLSKKEKVQRLEKLVHDKMTYRSKNSNIEYVTYKKKDN